MSKSASFHVVIVEDSEDDRDWIARLLREDDSTQYTIERVGCLEDALALLATRPIEIAIADWELPDGTGIELARHPTVVSQRIPVIVITGSERPEQGVFAVGSGAADFLPKDDLTSRSLARACAHAAARSALEREIDALRQTEVEVAQRERSARLEAERALADERKLRARIAALHDLSSALGAAGSTEEVAAAVVERLPRFERASAVSVYVLRGDVAKLEASAGFAPGALDGWTTLALERDTPLTNALRERRTVRIDDYAALRESLPEVRAPEGSWLAVPLLSRDEPLGVLGVRFERETAPPFDGVDYIELVAKNVAEALYRAKLYEEARVAAEFEERLLAVVGHDLRTPLSAVTMVAQVLKSKAVEPPLVARLERSAQRMSALITDVLDRAALRRGSVGPRRVAAARLEAVVRDQLEELRAALPQAEVRLEVRGPVEAECDPTRVGQVVANLVRNAAQHGLPGAPVTVRLVGEAGRSVLSVHNLGPLIPAEDIPELFLPFTRGRRAGGGGMGLGLFIVHETVDALGGSVAVTSNEQGTTFTVVLPDPVPEPA